MDIFSQIKIKNNEHLYIKDPTSSDLGKNILNYRINLIDELGFDSFTFKKLAAIIGTTEASVYRYFESKTKLLLYLVNWYWGCIATRILIETQNIQMPEVRLRKVIHILASIPNPEIESVLSNEAALKFIVMNESSKVLFTKTVDDVNKDGVFSVLKQLVEHLAKIVLELNPNYPYPNMLISSMIEGSNHQHFFAAHLPRLTNKSLQKNLDMVESFYTDLIFKAIKNE